MGRFNSRMFSAVLILLALATACAMSPALDRPDDEDDGARSAQSQGRRAAQQLLDEVVRQVLRDDTGSYGSELRFRKGQVSWGGNYGLHDGLAEIVVTIKVPDRSARDLSTYIDVFLDGGKAYVRRTSMVGPWIELSKRHIFPDLSCWPAKQRRLPDRSLMLLFSARAARLEGDRNQSVIVATVPARLVSTIFPDPSLAELVGSDASTPVTIRIGNFRGQLTTLEVEGSAVKAALERAGAPLRPSSARDLSEAGYRVNFSSFGYPLVIRPPAQRSVVHTGGKVPLPQTALPCVATAA